MILDKHGITKDLLAKLDKLPSYKDKPSKEEEEEPIEKTELKQQTLRMFRPEDDSCKDKLFAI